MEREKGHVISIDLETRYGKIKPDALVEQNEILKFNEDQLDELDKDIIRAGMQVTYNKEKSKAINIKIKHEEGEVFYMDPVTREGTIAFASLSNHIMSLSQSDKSQQAKQYELLNFIAANLKEPRGTIIREGVQVTYIRVKNKANDIAIDIKPELF